MDKNEQRARAEAFLALHRAPPLLLLANAWDVSSAKVFELAGFRAVGTTSAGIAPTLGHADGQRMRPEDNVEVVGRIAGHVSVPVSADMEAGYSDAPEAVAECARAMIDAGAVGVNIEDGTGDTARPLADASRHAEKTRAVRDMALRQGIPIVINARTDVYLAGRGDRAARLSQTVERARTYVAAGADCIFVPDTGDLDGETIGALVRAIDAPLNIIAGAHTPPVRELERLGVARVSLGPRPMRAALGLLQRMARELLDEGTYDLMTDGALGYAEVNGWFARGQV